MKSVPGCSPPLFLGDVVCVACGPASIAAQLLFWDHPPSVKKLSGAAAAVTPARCGSVDGLWPGRSANYSPSSVDANRRRSGQVRAIAGTCQLARFLCPQPSLLLSISLSARGVLSESSEVDQSPRQPLQSIRQIVLRSSCRSVDLTAINDQTPQPLIA